MTPFSRERRWSVLPFMAVLGLLAVLLPQVEATGTRIPTPAEIIGFEPGTDRTLVDYDQLIPFMRAPSWVPSSFVFATRSPAYTAGTPSDPGLQGAGEPRGGEEDE